MFLMRKFRKHSHISTWREKCRGCNTLFRLYGELKMRIVEGNFKMFLVRTNVSKSYYVSCLDIIRTEATPVDLYGADGHIKS